ncbi:HAD-IC family P-type ATPase [Luethyella okanaganae]|uniref:HAD-IC family P-type ATPase n=1 Tax=Luethyella okanaganae TaxID=69372 RepID=A0ABW1VEL8_9MICO
MTVVDVVAGLTTEDVARRLAAGQGNRANQPTSRSVWDIMRENVFTLFNAILTACFIAVLVLGDLRDGLFYGVVVANALIGIVQELRAKFVLDRLALLASPEVAVKRDGAVLTIPLDRVVIDDLLVLRPGDQLPADAVVFRSTGLLVDESLLTGESEPVAKNVKAPLLSGSHVVGGTGYGVVTAVGANSYANKLTSEIKRHSLVHSELRAATNRILVWLSWILGPVIVITLIGRVVAYGGIHVINDFGDGMWRRALLDSVASVVGMIPEGLVLLISLAFGVAAIQLARHKVLVQELAAVEVLARVDVLCLDKTGTLTSGELDFDRLEQLAPHLSAQSEVALAAFGADDAANATARVLAAHFGAASDENRAARVAARLPFSSTTKYSGVQLEDDDGITAWLFGAPERLLGRHPVALESATAIAAEGRRTLALVRMDGPLPAIPPDNPSRLDTQPAALVVFREEIREDAQDTLRYFAEQGVRVIVMSGDNPVTVSALGRHLGLDESAVDASALSDDDALEEALAHASVLGRVSPDQKRRAVAILQAQGRTVAMTGDGVNDAMAIKDADLGIAMGTATPATKAVSRIVLLDNRFDRLPDVLGLGRRVIANVERVANLFLSKTVYGIVLALAATALVVPFPFLPRQLTLVSTLAIGIPSFFLALAPNRRIYTPGVLRRIVSYAIPTGVIAAATCVVTYLPIRGMVPLGQARSVTTVALFIVSLWILCVLARPLSGPRLALVLSVAVAMLLACTVPFSRAFFALELELDPALLWGLGVGLLGAGCIEVMYRFAKHRALVFDRM